MSETSSNAGPTRASNPNGAAQTATKSRVRDAARTQGAILAAARYEFTHAGFEGARIDAIAKRAETNKRMLYHYFENKEGLYKAVMIEAYREIRQGERELELDQYDPIDAVDRLVRFTFRHFLRSPWFIALLTNENLLQARYIKTMPEIQGMHSPLVEQLRKLIERGGAAGVFRTDIEPVQLYISIAALGWFYVSNNATLSVIFETDLRAPDKVAAREDHAVAMVLDHLRLAPRDPR